MTMTWSDATTAWRTEMLAAGRSPGTVRLRLYHLYCWQRVCQHPESATRAALLAWLGRESWSPETRRSTRSSLVGFYSWLFIEGWIEHNPAGRLPKVSVPIPEPRPATDDAIREALDRATPRVWLMLLLAAIGGLRRAEIARVHTRDLDGNRLRVYGKGRKVRTIDLPAWLAAKVAAREGWAFPAPNGEHLTPGHVGVLMSRALPDGTTPHQLRHAAATRLHEEGLSMEEIRRFLGHSSISTTQLYVKTFSTRTAAAIDRAALRFVA